MFSKFSSRNAKEKNKFNRILLSMECKILTKQIFEYIRKQKLIAQKNTEKFRTDPTHRRRNISI